MAHTRRHWQTDRPFVRRVRWRGYAAPSRLGPYQSLALLSVSTNLGEPLKLIAVVVAGDGHWITGTVVIIAAYVGREIVQNGQAPSC
jgi:hypothetical protein